MTADITDTVQERLSNLLLILHRMFVKDILEALKGGALNTQLNQAYLAMLIIKSSYISHFSFFLDISSDTTLRSQ